MSSDSNKEDKLSQMPESTSGQRQDGANQPKNGDKKALANFWAQLSEFGEEADCKKYWSKQMDLRNRYLEDVIEIERRLQELAKVAMRKDDQRKSDDKKRKREESDAPSASGKLQVLAEKLTRVKEILESEPIGDAAALEDQTAKLKLFIETTVIPIGRKIVKTGLPSDSNCYVFGAHDDLPTLKTKYLGDVAALLSSLATLSKISDLKDREHIRKMHNSSAEKTNKSEQPVSVISSTEKGAVGAEDKKASKEKVVAANGRNEDQNQSNHPSHLQQNAMNNPMTTTYDRIQWLIKNASRVVEVLKELESTHPPRTPEVLLQVQKFAHEVLVPIGQKLIKGKLPSEKAAERRMVPQHAGVHTSFPQAMPIGHFQMSQMGVAQMVPVGMPQVIGVGIPPPPMSMIQVGGMPVGGMGQICVPGMQQVGNVQMGTMMPPPQQMHFLGDELAFNPSQSNIEDMVPLSSGDNVTCFNFCRLSQCDFSKIICSLPRTLQYKKGTDSTSLQRRDSIPSFPFYITGLLLSS
jgi:hypothetical protein